MQAPSIHKPRFAMLHKRNERELVTQKEVEVRGSRFLYGVLCLGTRASAVGAISMARELDSLG